MNSAANRIISSRMYADAGVRELQHALKAGCVAASRYIASEMATFVPEGVVLVPVPGRHGRGGAALRLATELGRMTGRPVVEGLVGCVRESVYEAKRRGADASAIDLDFRQDTYLGDRVLLVDNVVGTGHTAASALRAIPGSTMLVHALDAAAFVL